MGLYMHSFLHSKFFDMTPELDYEVAPARANSPECRFLLGTYGRDLLSSGSGVLDIAGGKGELAFELVNLNNIPATVVEPRALKLAKQELWLKVGIPPTACNMPVPFP